MHRGATAYVTMGKTITHVQKQIQSTKLNALIRHENYNYKNKVWATIRQFNSILNENFLMDCEYIKKCLLRIAKTSSPKYNHKFVNIYSTTNSLTFIFGKYGLKIPTKILWKR